MTNSSIASNIEHSEIDALFYKAYSSLLFLNAIQTDMVGGNFDHIARTTLYSSIVNIAVYLRNSIENDSYEQRQNAIKLKEIGVIQILNKNTAKPLTLFAACHKILHSHDISIEEPSESKKNIDCTLLATGEYQGDTWHAEFPVEEFLKHSYDYLITR